MRKIVRTPLLAVILVGGLAGTALATPAVGFNPTLLARATLHESVHHNAGEVKFQTKGPVDITHQTLTIDPLGSSGWHTHPGVVLVTVKSGSLVRYHDDCSWDVYSAGDAFTESGRHAGLVRNESRTTPAITFITYVTPVAAPLRLDAANPGCPNLS